MIKNRIKELRRSQGITLNKLVELLSNENIKVNASQLSKFEKGTSSPRNNEIWEALSNIFDADIAYIKGDSPFKNNKHILSLVSALDSTEKLHLDEKEWDELFLRASKSLYDDFTTDTQEKFEEFRKAEKNLDEISLNIERRETEKLFKEFLKLSKNSKEKVNNYINDLLELEQYRKLDPEYIDPSLININDDDLSF